MTGAIPLTRHGAEVGSVFGLMGADENDLTAALGFVLSRCPPLTAAITQRLAAVAGNDADGAVALALEVRGVVGRTDLEIRMGNSLYIVEAKRGWLLPSRRQLAQYADRVAGVGQGALVSLSQASQALASQCLPEEIEGVPVIHLSWRDVLADVEHVKTHCRGHDRFVLDQFRAYVKEVIRVTRVGDSWTYCVVLNNHKPAGGAATFKQIVTEQLSYFHPYGARNSWPTEPPNFMAFRWAGAVRRIHRVIEHEVVPRLSERWPDINDEQANQPHAVYRLGPRLPPSEPLENGAIYPSARVWALLDQLQTAPTLADAVAASKALRDRC